MKLSKEVVQRRVKLMQKEGIDFRLNTHVGKDLSAKVNYLQGNSFNPYIPKYRDAHVQELYDEYDAIVLATGATWPRDLPIPGNRISNAFPWFDPIPEL